MVEINKEEQDKIIQDIGNVLSEYFGIYSFIINILTDDGPVIMGTAMQNAIFLNDCAERLTHVVNVMMKEKIEDDNGQ